jgi:hypothetical protein
MCGRTSSVSASPEDPAGDLGGFENMFSSMFAALACQPCSEWRAVSKNRIDSVVHKSFRLKEGAGEKEHSVREAVRRDIKTLLDAQTVLFGCRPLSITDRLVDQCISDPSRARAILLRTIGEIAKDSNLPNALAIIAAGRIT